MLYIDSVLKDTDRKEGILDKELLAYEIKHAGFTRPEFCEKVGISLSAFSKKVNGKTQFTLDEIKTIMAVLNLDDPIPIFFAKEVS